MIQRERYINKLIQYKDSDFVKVITGVRRSGKSSLLTLFKDYLIDQGVDEHQIIEINYEKFLFDALKDEASFHEYCQQKIDVAKAGDAGTCNATKTAQSNLAPTTLTPYILIDEVQELPNWAKVINSLRVSYGADIYVTGSNARVFAGEHLTYLSGRYVEIKVFPLSFTEFLRFKGYSEYKADDAFNEYLRIGSFPAVSLANQEELEEAIVSGLFDSIFTRDIMLRGNIRDVGAFYKVAKFVFENIGNTLSALGIKNTLVSHGHKITSDTVDNYLQLMCNAHILYQCERYDIRGKERLKTNGKYYVVDMGLRNRLIGHRQSNLGHVVENLVFLQLLRLGYEVTVGKNMTHEVDFIAVKGEKRLYVQVCLTALEESTYTREVSALLNIKDQYPKYLISLDKVDLSKDGIVHVRLLDFLLEKVEL